MSEAVQALGLALAYLALLAALGAAPAAWLARGFPSRAALAPALGLAIAATVLVSLAQIMSMRTAAWAVVLPGAVVSLGAAAWRGRHARLVAGLRAAVVPVAIALAAVVLSVLPGMIHDTKGPLSLAVFDAWGYVEAETWLQDHPAEAALPRGAERDDLTLAWGHTITGDGYRIGTMAVNAAAATLLGQSPEETDLAQVAALLAALTLALWWMAVCLGAGRIGAAVAGVLGGLSPAVLLLVADTTIGNLAALVVAPAALLIAGRCLADRGPARHAVAAGLLGAGLVALFPEFLPPTAAIAGLGGALLVLVRRRRGSLGREALKGLAWRAALILGITLAASPPALERAFDLLRGFSSDSGFAAGLPPRWLSPENVGSWAFGVTHIYELSRWATLGEGLRIVAVLLPIVLAATVVYGALGGGVRRVAFLLLPVGTSIVFGIAAFYRYQGEHCQYCLWKALTYMLPFLAAGLGLGVERLATAPRSARWRPIGAGVAVAVVLASLAAITRADVQLTRARDNAPGIVPSGLRALSAEVERLPGSPRILIEGTDGSVVPFFTLPAVYYEARGGGRARPSFDATGPGGAYLGAGERGDDFYDPGYQYVVSAYPGIATNRTLLGRAGPVTLSRRAPVDVLPTQTGWSLDPNVETGAIPWINGDFQLWISSPRARPVAVRVTLDRPLHDRATLDFARAGGPLTVHRAPGGGRLCLSLPARAGRTVVTVHPVRDKAPVVESRATESDPFPSPPRAIGLAGLVAAPGACPSGGTIVPTLAYDDGWFPQEYAPDLGGRPFRWLKGPRASLTLGGAAERSTMTFSAESFLVPRTLQVRVDGRVVARLSVPANVWRRFRVALPPGAGTRRIGFVAHQPGLPAARVNPADGRRLAVAVTEPQFAGG